MDQGQVNQDLGQIPTVWTDLFEAQAGPSEAVSAARRRLVLRYYPAVRAYLLGVSKDPNVADELCQEFTLRLMAGAFRRADPDRGHFRDFLKASLRHLVIDYHRREGRKPAPLSP